MLNAVWLLGLLSAAHALVVAPPAQRRLLRTSLPRTQEPVASYGRPPNEEGGDAGFSFSGQQFDILSLRSFRRDTILQYDATNQSEPLRIALTLFGVLFSLSVPALSSELRIGDELTADVGAVLGAGISGALFLRNRGARTNRMAKIDKEYALGDLRATFRGVQTRYLRELRGKRRVVAVVGTRSVVDGAIAEARVYRRRITAADAVVVPVYTDVSGGGGGGDGTIGGEAESKYLWTAADPAEWQSYFRELLDARGMTSSGANGAWIGLNVKGRTFGSALGSPKWDELLGTALQPVGDGFGDFKEVKTSAEEAAAEAAATASSMGTVARGAEANAEAVAQATELLAAQSTFYDALTSGDVTTMNGLWDMTPDPAVSETLADGARIEPWKAGSPSFPPSGMRPSDSDALILSPTEAWTTAVERPAEGGTLLATQRWSRASEQDEWKIATHRYIPWSADGATAVAALRCDGRGCVLLGRQINTRAP